MNLESLAVFCCLLVKATAELFTSISSIEGLVASEPQIVSSLRDYVFKEAQRLQLLNLYIDHYEKVLSNAAEQGEHLNPVGAYKLIKNVYFDWKNITAFIQQNSLGDKFIESVNELRKESKIEFPSEDDYIGAVIAILRLQDTYDLKPSNFVQGNLRVTGQKSVSYPQALTAKDCYDIGEVAYDRKDFYHAVQWMQEAFTLATIEKANGNLTLKETTPEKFSDALRQQGNPEMADFLMHRLLSDSADTSADAETSKQQVEKEELNIKDPEWYDPKELPPIVNNRPFTYEDFSKYELLCRGEVPESSVVPKKAQQLYCFYKSHPAFARIFSLKMEVAHLHPVVYTWRDALSDNVSAELVQMAAPNLGRAKTFDPSGNFISNPTRTSQNTWIREYSPTVNALHYRISLMTGLETEKSAELLQMNNYGMGGHYEPHYDFTRPEVDGPNPFANLGTGNRIATVLLYLTEPELGGATVFPKLDLTVFPSKNDAVFWYDLKANGEGDYRTLHAGCPVLSGQKWVANCWIHEKYQEFRRPCDLDPDK